MGLSGIQVKSSSSAALSLLECVNTFEQVKEQHAALKARLDDLLQTIEWDPNGSAYVECSAALDLAKDKFIAFMEDVERYLAREERSLFPVARPQTGGAMGPVNVLVQDHVLAKEFFGEFLEKNRRYELTGEYKDAEEALTYLMQLLMIVSEHLRVEEDVLFPTTERLMEDIEHNGL